LRFSSIDLRVLQKIILTKISLYNPCSFPFQLLMNLNFTKFSQYILFLDSKKKCVRKCFAPDYWHPRRALTFFRVNKMFPWNIVQSADTKLIICSSFSMLIWFVSISWIKAVYIPNLIYFLDNVNFPFQFKTNLQDMRKLDIYCLG